ncbi:MAG: Fic family protein [Luteimonas sp.]
MTSARKPTASWAPSSLAWPDIRNRAAAFARDRKDVRSEREEAQTFWNEFFEIFGVDRRRTGVRFEKAAQRFGKPGKGLGGIYAWAGEYRGVNIAKGGFMFAAAAQVPRLMADFGRKVLAVETPCADMQTPRLIAALARTHAELLLIHPFREGNGRCARLLAYLMVMQAGLPSLDFSSFAGRGKRAYIAAIHAALDGDYAPMEARFANAIRLTLLSFWKRP